MNRPLIIFIALQLMDFATTLMALSLRETENNPLVSHFLLMGHVRGLLVSKLVLIGIAWVGVSMRKEKGVRWANAVCLLVVVWNVSVIVRLASSAWWS